MDFESPAKLKEMQRRLKELVKAYQFREVSDVLTMRSTRPYSVTFTDSQGAVRKIDWALASTAESRQMLAKHAQLKEQLQPPFLIEYAPKTARRPRRKKRPRRPRPKRVWRGRGAPGTAAEAKPAKRNSKVSHDPVEKKTAREVFEYVIEQGKKEYQVQRYKGLGEMTAPQLWDTTMDPERRTLLQVRLEDIAACEEIFTTLMGEDVESRRKFIEENALDVKNLDI